MRLFKLAGMIPALALGLAVASPASALRSLIGDEVTVTLTGGGPLNPKGPLTETVDSTVEFIFKSTSGLDAILADVGANSITLTNVFQDLTPASFNALASSFAFTGLDFSPVGKITGATITSSPGTTLGTGFTTSFTDDSFTMNFDAVPGDTTFWKEGDSVTANLNVVPIPAALPLLLTVFGGLGLAARARRKAA